MISMPDILDQASTPELRARPKWLAHDGARGSLTPERMEQLGLRPEVNTEEAAQILDCDRRTVVKYIKNGLLEWRDVSPPGNRRPTFRITLASVVEMRNSYRKSFPRPADGGQEPHPQNLAWPTL